VNHNADVLRDSTHLKYNIRGCLFLAGYQMMS